MGERITDLGLEDIPSRGRENLSRFSRVWNLHEKKSFRGCGKRGPSYQSTKGESDSGINMIKMGRKLLVGIGKGLRGMFEGSVRRGTTVAVKNKWRDL